jgi:DNA-binding GntR family transcriptional regulator
MAIASHPTVPGTEHARGSEAVARGRAGALDVASDAVNDQTEKSPSRIGEARTPEIEGLAAPPIQAASDLALRRCLRIDVSPSARWIASEVAKEIIERKLQPLADLNSVELARRFGTSRSPVREALIALNREGLVILVPRRRPRVASISLAEAREIYMVRATLYALVARQFVERATRADLDELRRLQHALEEAARNSDFDSYLWNNVLFRERELVATGNSILKAMLDSVALRAMILRRQSIAVRERLPSSVADHGRLVQAYEEGDVDIAIAISQRLVYRGLDALESVASSWPHSPST